MLTPNQLTTNVYRFVFALTCKAESSAQNANRHFKRADRDKVLRQIQEKAGLEIEEPMPENFDYDRGDIAFTGYIDLGDTALRVNLRYKDSQERSDKDACGAWQVFISQNISRSVHALPSQTVRQALGIRLGDFFIIGDEKGSHRLFEPF